MSLKTTLKQKLPEKNLVVVLKNKDIKVIQSLKNVADFRFDKTKLYPLVEIFVSAIVAILANTGIVFGIKLQTLLKIVYQYYVKYFLLKMAFQATIPIISSFRNYHHIRLNTCLHKQ